MKILIWIEKLESRRGGPTTYLYNLKESVTFNKLNDNIHFLADYKSPAIIVKAPTKESPAKQKVKEFLKKLIPKKIKSNVSAINYLKLLKKQKEQKLNYTINFDKYDSIHFHSALDLYKNFGNLSDFRGKIVLTTHCPKAPHLEIIEDELRTSKEYLSEKLYRQLEFIDKFSFEKADKLIFPCKEALEPYYNTWPEFGSVISGKNIGYVATATGIPLVQKSKDQIRELYNIPSKAFLIVYAGRHNFVKGYDVLNEFGAKALELYPDLHFLIAGKEDPLKGLSHPRWKEIGWTTDPHSIINAANLFVLPNKETYFDLIALEVLALGKVMLVSNVGGNKYFKKFNDVGISFFEKNDMNGMLKQFDQIYNTSAKELMRLECSNIALYYDQFSLKQFALNYYKVMS